MLRPSFLRLLTRRVATSKQTETPHFPQWTTAMGFFTFNQNKQEPDASPTATDGVDPGGVTPSAWDPERITELARIADSATIGQEASEHWPIVAGVQHSLDWIHTTTGSPWWMTIAFATIVFRSLIFPITLIQIKNSVRLSNAMPDTDAVKDRFEKMLSEGKDAAKSREWYTKEIAKVWNKHGCNPMKSMLPLLANGFVFVSFFIALRGLAENKVSLFLHRFGLIGWTDLTLADPYYILPVVNSAIFLITVELGAVDGMQGTAPEMISRMKTFMRMVSLVFIPLTASFPASLFCYWITSSIFSLIQATSMKNDSVRKFLRVPLTPKRSNFDPFKNRMFGGLLKPVLQKAETPSPVKAKARTTEETRAVWMERMRSVVKGPGEAKSTETPVLFMSTPPKNHTQKKTKIQMSRKK